MSDTSIFVRPAGKCRTTGQRYAVFTDSRMRPEDFLTSARSPFTAAARALIERGADPDSVLTMWGDEPGEWRLRARIGKAAMVTVAENARISPSFVLYSHFPPSGGV